ncbi:MAG: helix-turn-helix domain-containing protein [Alphaproteobacteria bacterium]
MKYTMYMKVHKKADYPLRKAIRETIEERGVNQSELCRRAGVNPSALYRYLRGQRDMLGRKVDAVRIMLGLILVDPLGDEDEEL